MNVFILGSGKLGRGLSRAIKRAGSQVVLRSARKPLPTRPISADLLVLAVRDRDLRTLSTTLAERRLVSPKTCCVHVAGALGPEPLEPLRAICAGVAQMHPMISFASPDATPSLAGGNVHVQGDPVAVRRARALARLLGMKARTFPGLDTVGYHASAGLVANGAAALAAIGAQLLAASGVPKETAPQLLGPLLRSVADNIELLGFPESLTGPVRRGDAAGIERQLALLTQRLPAAVPLFLETARAQLPLARALADAPKAHFDALARVLENAQIPRQTEQKTRARAATRGSRKERSEG